MRFYIDFEATQPGNEIIAIGAVPEMTTWVDYGFKTYVAPKQSEITPYVAQLTGIKPDQLSSAISFEEAINQLGAWCIKEDPNYNQWEFHCYGNCDKDFIDTSMKLADTKLFTRVGLLVANALAYHFIDDSQKIFKYFNQQISLIKAYNWAKELNDKQDHDPQKDAEMLKFVNIFVEQKSALPNCPYGAKTIKSSNGLGVCEASYVIPHGAFWCKGTGKNSKKHNFNSCDEAIDWLITTQYAAQDKPIARRDRIATNIMMAIRKKGSYKGFHWGRLKEDII